MALGPERFNRFERNVNVWRQFWRVTELGTMFIIVVDARFAGFLCPPTLISYLQKQFPQKPILILINKCDLVPGSTVEAWAKFFVERYGTIQVSTMKCWGDLRTQAIEVKQEKIEQTKVMIGNLVEIIKEIAKSIGYSLVDRDFGNIEQENDVDTEIENIIGSIEEMDDTEKQTAESHEE